MAKRDREKQVLEGAEKKGKNPPVQVQKKKKSPANTIAIIVRIIGLV